jgi:glycosyltransferase involved in cell wall biosynthesis
MTPYLSFVIPFLDEEATITPLFDGIAATVRESLPGRDFEVIFIDDGSRDGSVDRVLDLVKLHPEATLIQLTGNFGKSAALAAGFNAAQGEIVFTLDADLQDDPREIPRFVEALESKDVVSGYKQKRHDPWHKVFPSRVFNALVRSITSVPVRDVNCGFKAYRSDVIRSIRLYGEMHRFVPILAHWKRFRVGEIVVEHHPRRHGVSKFGFGRFYRGFLDLITVAFLMRFEHRPAHFFGVFGGLLLVSGVGVELYLTVLKLMGEAIGHRPLLLLGVLLIVVGVQIMGFGLIAELLVYLQRGSVPYTIRRTVTHPTQPPQDQPVRDPEKLAS